MGTVLVDILMQGVKFRVLCHVFELAFEWTEILQLRELILHYGSQPFYSLHPVPWYVSPSFNLDAKHTTCPQPHTSISTSSGIIDSASFQQRAANCSYHYKEKGEVRWRQHVHDHTLRFFLIQLRLT